VESQAAAASHDTHLLEFAESFKTAQGWLSKRVLMQSLYFLVDGRSYRQAVQRVRRFAEQIIQFTLQKRLHETKSQGERYSVVEELAKTTQDPTEIRDQVIGKFWGGSLLIVIVNLFSSARSWKRYYIGPPFVALLLSGNR
jgi:hypothetical protein